MSEREVLLLPEILGTRGRKGRGLQVDLEVPEVLGAGQEEVLVVLEVGRLAARHGPDTALLPKDGEGNLHGLSRLV